MRIENMNISLNEHEKSKLGISGLKDYLTQNNVESLVELLESGAIKNHIPTCESMTWSDFLTRLSLSDIPLDVLYAIKLDIGDDMSNTYYKASTLVGHIIFSTIPTVGTNIVTSRELDVNKSKRTASIRIFDSTKSTVQSFTPTSSNNVTLYYNAADPY